MRYAIEKDFPFEEVDPIAEAESYRKEINRPIYHIHKWWARRLGSVFRSVVSGALSEGSWRDFHELQDFSGKVVLDPFMGSGTTLGEAAKLGAHVVGCDANPVSAFMVRQALTRVNPVDLETEFRSIEKDVRDRILSYHTTMVPGEETPARALYHFWVKTVTTPGGEEIPLFPSYVFARNSNPGKKPEARILCPECRAVFSDVYDAQSATCPECSRRFDPRDGPARGASVRDSRGREHRIRELVRASGAPPAHRLYAVMALDEAGERTYVKPTGHDFAMFRRAAEDLEEMKDRLPLPSMDVRPGHNTDQARGYNYLRWRDFFNARQLLCLGLLLERILRVEDSTLRDHFVCLFSGTLEFNNMFCSFKGEGTGAVRHLFSNHILKPEKTPLENTVWGIEGKSSGTFSSLFGSRLLRAKSYLYEPFEIVPPAGGNPSRKVVCSRPLSLEIADGWEGFGENGQSALVLNGDGASLPVPDSSVDAVVTDPPYFDFVHYSELGDFFYAWLKAALGDEYEYLGREDSSHENEVQDRDVESFSRKLGSVFSECARVLRPDGLLCFSYHHSTPEGWVAVYEAVTRAGFGVVAAHPVKAEMSVASPKSAASRPINVDAILVCRKEFAGTGDGAAETEAAGRVRYYEDRLRALGRKLGGGDRFVIACSQALIVASGRRLSAGETERLLLRVSSELAETEPRKRETSAARERLSPRPAARAGEKKSGAGLPL